MKKNTASSLGYTAEEYRRFRHYALRYLLLFSLLYMAHYCTRLNLTNASALMIDELHWTKADIGVLSSALFWAYGIGQLVNGRLSEIVGPDRFVFLSVILSAAVNFLFGFQTSLTVMAILWALNGFFQSMAWAPGIAILTRWWPGDRHGFAVGFAHAFSGFGQVAATLVVVAAFRFLPDLGWRAAFVLPPLIPLAVLLFFAVFARCSPSAVGLPDYQEKMPGRAGAEEAMLAITRQHGKLYPYKYMLGRPAFLVWCMIALLAGLARYGLTTWVPLYFIDNYGFDLNTGLLRSLALPLGMGIGTLIVPTLTDRFCPEDRIPAVILSAIAAALSVCAFRFIDPTLPSRTVLLELTLFFAGFFIYAIYGTSLVHAADIGGRVFSGTCSGILNFSAYAGAAVQSLTYGFLLEKLGWGMVFGSMAFFCLVIAALGLLSRRAKHSHLGGTI